MLRNVRQDYHGWACGGLRVVYQELPTYTQSDVLLVGLREDIVIANFDRYSPIGLVMVTPSEAVVQ